MYYHTDMYARLNFFPPYLSDLFKNSLIHR